MHIIYDQISCDCFRAVVDIKEAVSAIEMCAFVRTIYVVYIVFASVPSLQPLRAPNI